LYCLSVWTAVDTVLAWVWRLKGLGAWYSEIVYTPWANFVSADVPLLRIIVHLIISVKALVCLLDVGIPLQRKT